MVTPSFQVFLIGSFDCVAFVKQKKRLLLFVELYNNILLPSRGGVLFFILVVYSSSSVLTFTINTIWPQHLSTMETVIAFAPPYFFLI